MKKIVLFIVLVTLITTLSSCNYQSNQVDLYNDLLIQANNTEDTFMQIQAKLSKIESNFINVIDRDIQETSKVDMVEFNQSLLEEESLDISKIRQEDGFLTSLEIVQSIDYAIIQDLKDPFVENPDYIETESTVYDDYTFKGFVNEDYVYSNMISESDSYYTTVTQRLYINEEEYILEEFSMSYDETDYFLYYRVSDSSKGCFYLSINSKDSTILFDYQYQDFTAKTNIYLRTELVNDIVDYVSAISTDYNEGLQYTFDVKESLLNSKVITYLKDNAVSFSHIENVKEDTVLMKYSLKDLSGWDSLRDNAIYNGDTIVFDLIPPVDFSVSLYEGIFQTVSTDEVTEETFLHPTDQLSYIQDFSYSDLMNEMDNRDDFVYENYIPEKIRFLGETFDDSDELIQYGFSLMPTLYKTYAGGVVYDEKY